MSQYLSRRSVIEKLREIEANYHKNYVSNVRPDVVRHCLTLVQCLPCETVREDKRAEWIGEADGYADGEFVYETWYCSNCDFVVEDDEKPRWSFCPNCGAKMEEQT